MRLPRISTARDHTAVSSLRKQHLNLGWAALRYWNNLGLRTSPTDFVVNAAQHVGQGSLIGHKAIHDVSCGLLIVFGQSNLMDPHTEFHAFDTLGALQDGI